MTTPARVATAAVIGVLAVGGALFMIGRPGQTGVGGPGPTATPTATPTPIPSPMPSPSPTPGTPSLPEGTLPAGTHVMTPFALPGSDACFDPDGSRTAAPRPGCTDTTNDDSIRVTLTVPAGWEAGGFGSIGLTDADIDPLAEAAMLVVRGGLLLSDPCDSDRALDEAHIPVGPTVDDFASALDEHPLLDVTTPVAVTLAGYTGKYMDLQVPADISACDVYRPWDPWLYAQGPGQRWHLWILDVDGVRVIVQGTDYAGTSAQHRAELQAIVASVKIES